MSKDANIELDGVIIAHNHSEYTVEVSTETGKTMTVKCTLSGKIRMNFIKVLVGDKVQIQVSPYDPSRGKITYRYK